VFTWENDDYLVTVDYFSRYFEVDLLTSSKSVSIIRKLKVIFSRYGIPEKLISDNAPYYVSETFKSFESDWNFSHVTSSPLYSQSNGLVEKTVQTIKRLFRKAKDSKTDPYMSILEYRTTPLKCGKSPSQLLMSRRLRTVLPINSEQLMPQKIDIKDVRMKLQQEHNVQKKYYDRQSKPLKSLTTGDTVRVQFDKQWKKGTVVDKQTDRSYVVRTNDGGIYRRNRKFLHKTKDQNDPCLPLETLQCLNDSDKPHK
jgi:hypothetical protein